MIPAFALKGVGKDGRGTAMIFYERSVSRVPDDIKPKLNMASRHVTFVDLAR
jgi:hypothetical protein